MTEKVNAPKPLKCSIRNVGNNCVGEAQFDAAELKTYLDSTSDTSFEVRDDNGNLVGIAQVSFMRQAFAESLIQGKKTTSSRPHLRH